MNSAKHTPVSIFPTIEHWKTALMQLPEGPFFDILRSYLGDIKTPFNKQRLVDDLAAFLSRQEIQRRIAALLDTVDRRCICAVALLHSGTLQDLAAFFAGEFSFGDLYGIILNLEERLIIYKTMEDGRPRLNLNPVLRPVLAPLLEDTSILFPAQPFDGANSEIPVPMELTLGALLTWLFNAGQAFKADGSLKKKSQEELESLFAPVGGTEVALGLIHALEYLGLIHIEEGIPHVDRDRLAHYAALESLERLEFLAAALIGVELELDSGTRRLSRERLHSWSRLIHRILLPMQEGWAYDEASLRRFWLVEEGRPVEKRRFGDRDVASHSGLAHCPGVNPLEFFRALRTAMERSGLIVGTEKGYLRNRLPKEKNPPFIVCDASFSIIVYPEIPFSHVCTLARLCQLREMGQILKLELTQEGFVRALDQGFRTEDICGFLEQLSAKPLSQHLAWSLEEWTRRYHSATLYKGLVLVLAPERRYIVELPMVKDFIERELAPGVYLLQGVDEAQLSEVLERAGLDTLARPEPSRLSKDLSSHLQSSPNSILTRANPFQRSSGKAWTDDESPGFYKGSSNTTILTNSVGPASPVGATSPTGPASPVGATSPRGSADLAGASIPAGTPGNADPADYAKHLLAELHEKLEAKPFTKEQKDELSARIDRRLILDERQLVAAAVRYEKLEARGLDYVGKVRLVEQALSLGALVEVFWRGAKGEANRSILRPIALEKSGTELMIRGESYPEGEALSLPIGKISLLRRLKRSIFGD
ncbi:MAG: hypothetical protein GX438_09030 [Treponema sp.]|nr:hypothetical protein [Treponema sp.]